MTGWFDKGLLKRLLAIGLLWAVLTTGLAQEINWYSMDSGGGVSAAKDIQLTAVIGQPDIARMSAGNISLSGGYLPMPVAAQADDLIFRSSFE